MNTFVESTGLNIHFTSLYSILLFLKLLFAALEFFSSFLFMEGIAIS